MTLGMDVWVHRNPGGVLRWRQGIKFLASLVVACVLVPGPVVLRGDGGLLIEAESFAEKGGWVVDAQFVEQMGSPYLLAHGLGRPVANAGTGVSIAKGGRYHVWVRTRDWAPGEWEPPGRFRVAFDGRPLGVEFGTRQGWAWQDGGSVDLPAGQVRVELHDLTGFDGRCDAIYLAPEGESPPPEERGALAAWRDRLAGHPADPPTAGEFDVVIIGGGIAGCGAAMAAAERGLRVALVQDRPVLGGNASSEIRVHTIGTTGYADRHISRINTGHWPNGSPEAVADERRRQATIDAIPEIRQFLCWRAYGVTMDGKRIVGVKARHAESGEARSFRAPAFIDCTGDGWIGYWAGADFRMGRESRDEFGEGWEEHGDLWSPERPDNRVMGVSLLWSSEKVAEPVPFPEVPWALAVANGKADVRGEWFWEYSRDDLDMIEDAEAIRDHLLRAIYGSFANAVRSERFASHQLQFVGYVSGKRESRRLMGDYVYTMRDMVEGTKFPDAVVTEVREIDVHFQRQYKDPTFPQDFLSTAIFRKTPRYYIPYRALYSRNIENLLMAGRCFSCSHIGLGGPRVMNTCGQMGVAVGYAASLMKEHGATPRGVYEKHLGELIALVKPDPAIDERLEALGSRDHFGQLVAPGAALHRVLGRFPIESVPQELKGAAGVVVQRGAPDRPAAGYDFQINVPATVYLAVHRRGEPKLPVGWVRTDMEVLWGTGTDVIYSQKFGPGKVAIPPHDGMQGKNYGLPHLALVMPEDRAARLEITGIEKREP